MEDKTYYKSVFSPVSNDYDCRKQFKLSTILKYMQVSAGWHLDDMDCPNELLIENRQVFLLLKVGMKIKQLPKKMMDIEVTTWSRGYKGATWIREYEFRDDSGNIFAEVSTTWVLFNPIQRTALRPNTFFMDFPIGDKSVGIDVIRRFKVEDSDLQGERVVRYSDLDTYMHMNNTVYADIVYDFIDSDIQQGLPKEFYINFNSEARLGDVLSISTKKQSNNQVYIKGCHDRGVCFEANLVVE